jgi:hypothetical protein
MASRVATNNNRKGKIMNVLFKAVLDGLTYKDLAGRRQPRTYSLLTGLLLVLMLVLTACVILERNAMLRAVQGTPAAVQIKVEPTSTAVPTQAAQTACPTDPADWDFVEARPGSNLKRIEPVCVQTDLAKSVAWALAVREGYTRAKATQALGFAEAPMRRLNEVTILTDTKGPLAMPVSFTPPHPDFAEWRVDLRGTPAVRYALRGCFRTSKVVGNRAEAWNTDYAVICTLSEDSVGTQSVFNLAGHTYTSAAQPLRSMTLFGYLGNGQWVWLGTQKDPKVNLTTLSNYIREAADSAAGNGAVVWDADWLAQTYGLGMQPLPGDWQAASNPADQQAILAGLNAALQEPTP